MRVSGLIPLLASIILSLSILPGLHALAVTPGGFTLPEGVTHATLSLHVLVDPGVRVFITPTGSLADYAIITPSRLDQPGWHEVTINLTIPPGVPRDLKLIVTSIPQEKGMLTARAGIIIPVSQGIRILLQESTITPTLIIFTTRSLPIHLAIQDENATILREDTFTRQPTQGRIIIPLTYPDLPYAPYRVTIRAGRTEKAYQVVLGTPRVEQRITWQDSCLAILTLTNPTREALRLKLLQPVRQDLGILQPGRSMRIPIRTCRETTLRVWMNGKTTSSPLMPPEASPRTSWLLALLIIAAILMGVAVIG